MPRGVEPLPANPGLRTTGVQIQMDADTLGSAIRPTHALIDACYRWAWATLGTGAPLRRGCSMSSRVARIRRTCRSDLPTRAAISAGRMLGCRFRQHATAAAVSDGAAG